MLAWPLHPAQSRLGRYIALPGYIQSATHCMDGRTVGLLEMHPGAGQRTERPSSPWPQEQVAAEKLRTMVNCLLSVEGVLLFAQLRPTI